MLKQGKTEAGPGDLSAAVRRRRAVDVPRRRLERTDRGPEGPVGFAGHRRPGGQATRKSVASRCRRCGTCPAKTRRKPSWRNCRGRAKTCKPNCWACWPIAATGGLARRRQGGRRRAADGPRGGAERAGRLGRRGGRSAARPAGRRSAGTRRAAGRTQQLEPAPRRRHQRGHRQAVVGGQSRRAGRSGQVAGGTQCGGSSGRAAGRRRGSRNRRWRRKSSRRFA